MLLTSRLKIINFSVDICEFVPNFEYGIIAYYSLDYCHDGFNSRQWLYAVMGGGVTFGHWVTQVAGNLFIGC
ncbi:hypothetical protein Hanom_Chr01g00026351 [Helianthus anomalus]